MPEPLEYRNPFRRSSDSPLRAAEAEPLPAIPAEFEVCVVNTADHAAARAIDTAFTREKLDFFRGEDQKQAGRLVTFYVRTADRDRAMDIAGKIFVCRAKLRAGSKSRPIELPSGPLGELWMPGI